MKMSPKGIELLKKFEGVKLKAYKDGGGVWTIGYGHTAAAGGLIPKLGVTITQKQADDLLVADLVKYERAVESVLKRVPTQSQFDAMTSLCYNIGPVGFRTSSVTRYFNEGQLAKSANAFLLWNKDNGAVVKGLSNRRAAEMALFMAADKPAAAPSAVPAPDTPKPQENAPSVTAKPPLTIQKVMVWLLGAIAAAVTAYFGFGGQ